MTDIKNPIPDNPVKSVIVLQIGETEEIVVPGLESSRPSEMVNVRLIRATYSDAPYSMREQRGYLFELCKYDINVLLSMCQEKIDEFLEGKESLDVNDSRFVNWNYQVSRG
jgi:hypothetical protein